MQLQGNQVLDAVPSTVWRMLMDPVILAKVVPGISSLEKLSENSFKSTLNIKIGPISGNFSGNLQLDEIVDQESFLLKAQQNSKIGNANASISITLAPVDEKQTGIKFDGEVKLSGMMATMGQRVIGGVANTLTKQFFANLEKELAVLKGDDKL
ncbi:MAG: carbon monoxide dehydrogenase subunit G [Chitinophagaceae bacterium]